MSLKRLANMMMAFLVGPLFFLSVAFGNSAKTLISYEGGKPGPGLAKSWKKVKDGVYEFTLDTSATIGKDKLTPALVKKSLEGKLGETNGVKVTPKGGNAVSVAYKGAEPEFLEAVSVTRIRSAEVELALESSVSGGGVRAKAADRPPVDGEVKALVIGAPKDGKMDVAVVTSKFPQIKDGKITVLAPNFQAKVNDTVFFKPVKLEGAAWAVKDLKAQ